MYVSVLVCETRSLSVYSIVFRHAGLPVGGKHSVFHDLSHGHVLSFWLVRQSGNLLHTAPLRVNMDDMKYKALKVMKTLVCEE